MNASLAPAAAAAPTDSRRLLLSLAIVLATMLYTIDSTIVNVALPHMQGTLQATQDQAAWILTSYIVVSAVMTPLAGWLGTRYGLRPVMLWSIAGFTLGSMLCGLATDLGQMVGFRILQGASGAALVPLAQVVLLQEFPREQHAKVTAMWGMGVLLGPVIGPTLGGWLTDEYSWRWAFYINLPVGVLSFVGLLATMRRGDGDAHRLFDLTGFILLSLAIGLFQLMLDRGQGEDWFESTEIVAEAFFAALCFYMFIAHSLTRQRPFVDLQLFRDRNFVLALIVMFAIGVAIFSPTVLLPGFLQQLQGYSPTQAGWLTAARGVSAMLAMLAAGRLVGRVDPRLLMATGVGATAVSLWMMGQFTLDTSAAQVVAAGLLQGCGAPLTFVPLSVVAFGTLSGPQRTEAGVLLTLTRNIGASVGISASMALLARSTQINQAYLTEHFTPYAALRWAAIAAQPGDPGSSARVLGEIGRQAAGISYANDFYIMAAATALALPLVLLLRIDSTRPQRSASG
ncbi:MAG: DHA2 family efflux MFS transporter permease subunit [Steroidobacteraceae bacterium]|nr:DHA2 family efflux MFS transporter permease subunit [Nevskiaceae bacterium]MCP5338866.1 DHA2 family efflux MFS transporter permease subunit [Nevskiaceae bacterium]MCP5360745.1 DHA2 family efflux MFS transporter permease subunit [Nevskiaceae bacterium]MCP5466219.1 DHA2 family efflux MFS transporter permease subunit [Nevskiaceae bacterium]